LPRRFRGLRLASVFGHQVPIAARFGARLLGLSLLPRERAGPGLLIPRCPSVHTFGMRFALDVYFLDASGAAIDRRLGVGPSRLVSCRGAAAVLELPAGGEPAAPRP
jgi:uncharacterized protein